MFCFKHISKAAQCKTAAEHEQDMLGTDGEIKTNSCALLLWTPTGGQTG